MLPARLQRVASGSGVIIAVALWLGYAVCFFTFGPYATLRGASGGDLLEESFGIGQEAPTARIRSFDEATRSLYTGFQWLDYVNAALMAVALTLILTFTLSRLLGPRNPLRILVFLPLVVGALEVVENSLLLSVLWGFPSEAVTAGMLLGPVTSAKLALAFAVLPVAGVSLVALGIRALRNRGASGQSKASG